MVLGSYLLRSGGTVASGPVGLARFCSLEPMARAIRVRLLQVQAGSEV